MSIAAGLLFGWASGGALAVLGATSGCRKHLPDRANVHRRAAPAQAGPRVQRLAAGFRAESFSYLLFLRLLPIMPFWVTNLAAALFGMRFRSSWSATLTRRDPGLLRLRGRRAPASTAAIAAHEQQLQSALQREDRIAQMHFEPESFLTPELIDGSGLLGILALGPIICEEMAGSAQGDPRVKKPAG